MKSPFKWPRATTISLKNLWFHYPQASSEAAVLRGVSLELQSGECVALIGPSGSGKSTLAQILNGLHRPTRGELLVDSRPLEYSAKSLRAWRRQLALVFQHPEEQIFEQTVYDEVAFAPRQWSFPESEIAIRVASALEAVGLPPALYGERDPLRLSGGEARLVSIASLLAHEPLWLILDEPTLGLDCEHGRRIESIITARRSAQKAVLLITHNLDLALKLCPRTIVLSEGRITFDGNTNELLQREDLQDRFGLAATETILIWRRLRREFPELPLLNLDQLLQWFRELKPTFRPSAYRVLQEWQRLQIGAN